MITKSIINSIVLITVQTIVLITVQTSVVMTVQTIVLITVQTSVVASGFKFSFILMCRWLLYEWQEFVLRRNTQYSSSYYKKSTYNTIKLKICNRKRHEKWRITCRPSDGFKKSHFFISPYRVIFINFWILFEMSNYFFFIFYSNPFH